MICGLWLISFVLHSLLLLSSFYMLLVGLFWSLLNRSRQLERPFIHSTNYLRFFGPVLQFSSVVSSKMWRFVTCVVMRLCLVCTQKRGKAKHEHTHIYSWNYYNWETEIWWYLGFLMVYEKNVKQRKSKLMCERKLYSYMHTIISSR